MVAYLRVLQEGYIIDALSSLVQAGAFISVFLFSGAKICLCVSLMKQLPLVLVFCDENVIFVTK
jgi:hypothetical protein